MNENKIFALTVNVHFPVIVDEKPLQQKNLICTGQTRASSIVVSRRVEERPTVNTGLLVDIATMREMLGEQMREIGSVGFVQIDQRDASGVE